MLQPRDVTMVFKFLIASLQVTLSQYLMSTVTKPDRKNHLGTTFRRTSTAQRTFFFRAIGSWNKLNEETKNSVNIFFFLNIVQVGTFGHLYFDLCNVFRKLIYLF